MSLCASANFSLKQEKASNLENTKQIQKAHE
jgi:hypothetical protein